MLACVPDLRDAVFACRSRSAKLPDGRLITNLQKFASMGSALCFPIEAMYFYTICVMARLVKHNLPVSPSNIFNVSRDVFVYGDDIIIPVEDAEIVLDYLQKYHCKVNTSKTFVTGKFRESCGVDVFDGVPVNPVYLRHLRPENKQQASELISWVATANLFYLKGYWRTSSHMFSICESILGPLPYISGNSSVLGRVSYLGFRSAYGWDDSSQQLVVEGYKPSPVYRSDSVDGYSALQKCLLRLNQIESGNDVPHRSDDPSWVHQVLIEASTDTRHLERTARRGAVTLKRRWAPLNA
jgi:hypothetical protein